MRGLSLSLSVMAVLLLAGCGSPFVGKWVDDGFTGKGGESSTLTMTINSDQTFTAVTEGADGRMGDGFSGTWDKDSDSRIRLFTRSGDGPKRASGELSDGDMIVVGEGLSARLSKD